MNKPVAKMMDYILVPIEEPGLTRGGLYVPDTAKKRINNGIVISKGSKTIEDIKLGDHVLFNGRSGDQITLVESGRFFIVPESHILAKLENSTVRVVDLETVKRVIRERFDEIRSRMTSDDNEYISTSEMERDICDRLDSLTISEGLDF